MRHLTVLWYGLKVIMYNQCACWQSMYQESVRHRRWRARMPMTVGEMLHDIMQESTDPYFRCNHLRYRGGTAAPGNDSAPHWITSRGVDQSMLYRYQIAHVVHQVQPETHPQTGAAKFAPLHVVRKWKTA